MKARLDALGRHALVATILLFASNSNAKETKNGKAAPASNESKKQDDASAEEVEIVVLEESEPEGESTDDLGFDEEADSGDAAPNRAASSPLDLQVGLGAIGRDLHFRDTGSEKGIKDFNPPYDNKVDAMFLPQFEGHWYPAAHFTTGALTHIGLGFSYARSVKAVTDYELPSGAASYNQTYQHFTIGLTGRIPIDVLTLGIDANYGAQSLWVRPESETVSDNVFSDVRYSYLEARLRADLQINHMRLSGYFGYLQVLSLGEISEPAWYENAKAMGLVYGGQVGFRVHPSWELVGGLDFRQYRLNFNPLDPVSAPRIAGGASDRYLSFSIGVKFSWPAPALAGSADPDAAQAAEAAEGSESDGFDSFD